MKKAIINIGTNTAGGPVDIDLETLLVTRALVQGASGAGKSRFLRRLAEQAFGKVPIIILDPEGEFASLREKFGFVLAGRGGETPADPRSAALLATKVLELQASIVCDLYSMKPLERHTFVRLFLESLLNADKNLWHPCLVIVDEAHRYAPEKGAGESEASEAMTALSTDGRKHGLCAIYATQRLGKLRKDAAAELLNVFIGQTFIDIDRGRAADALGVPKGKDQRELFDRLKVLPRGSFYGLGQAVSLDALLIKTGDVQTTHPKVGAKTSGTVPPAPEAIKALLPQLADLPKQAEDKARTEAEFRKEIADLRRQLKTAPVTPVVKPDPQREQDIYRKAFDEGSAAQKKLQAQERAELLKTITSADKGLQVALSQSNHALELLHSDAKMVSPPMVRLPDKSTETLTAPSRVYIPAQSSRPAESNGNGKLPVGERAILKACAEYPNGADKTQLTVLTGYKRSTRDAYIQRLREKGFIEERGQTVWATVVGCEALGDFDPLPTGTALRDHWLNKLPSGERRILEVLVNASAPHNMSRDEIDASTGFKRSTRDAYLQRMEAKKIVEFPDRGTVRASKLLWD